MIKVSISKQTLELYKDEQLQHRYVVSTAQKGVGQYYGSMQTPLGLHRIAEKIGAGMLVNTVFVARVPTGELYTPELAALHPERDWILTRILWLEGLEEGLNRGGDVDSKNRKIYIHASPDSCPMGQPLSHGCIRMHNKDIVELFNLVNEGTEVLITLD